MVQQHEITVKDLAPGTCYYFKVGSTDISGKWSAFSGNLSLNPCISGQDAPCYFRIAGRGDKRDESDD